MENNKKKYWGKTITSFVFVLFTMPLGHAMMRIMEDTMSHSAVNTSAVIMGFVGLAMAVIGVFVKGDTKRTIWGLFGALLFGQPFARQEREHRAGEVEHWTRFEIESVRQLDIRARNAEGVAVRRNARNRFRNAVRIRGKVEEPDGIAYAESAGHAHAERVCSVVKIVCKVGPVEILDFAGDCVGCDKQAGAAERMPGSPCHRVNPGAF